MRSLKTERTESGLHYIHLPGNGTREAALIFLHALWSGSWQFEKWLTYARSVGYDVYALDFRGHHGSRPCDIGNVGVEDNVQDVINFMRECGIRRKPTFIGHSYGGLVAQFLASLDIAAKVILVSSVPPKGISLLREPIAKRLFRLHYLRSILTNKPLLISFEDAMELGLRDFPDPGELYGSLVPDSGKVVRQIALGVPIPRFRCPSLVLSGGRDLVIQPHIQAAIAGYFHSPHIMLMSHGHMMMLEDGWEKPIWEILDFIS